MNEQKGHKSIWIVKIYVKTSKAIAVQFASMVSWGGMICGRMWL